MVSSDLATYQLGKYQKSHLRIETRMCTFRYLDFIGNCLLNSHHRPYLSFGPAIEVCSLEFQDLVLIAYSEIQQGDQRCKTGLSILFVLFEPWWLHQRGRRV